MVTIKRPAKKKAELKDDPVLDLVTMVVDMVKGKELDAHLSSLDNAISSRITDHEVEKGKAKQAAKKTQTKGESISKPPVKKSGSASKVPANDKPDLVPVAGKVYKVDSRVKKVGGQKVEFVRKYSKDETKSVVKMVTEVPGIPKGKVFPIPTSALEPIASRRVARKV